MAPWYFYYIFLFLRIQAHRVYGAITVCWLVRQFKFKSIFKKKTSHWMIQKQPPSKRRTISSNHESQPKKLQHVNWITRIPQNHTKLHYIHLTLYRSTKYILFYGISQSEKWCVPSSSLLHSIGEYQYWQMLIDWLHIARISKISGDRHFYACNFFIWMQKTCR